MDERVRQLLDNERNQCAARAEVETASAEQFWQEYCLTEDGETSDWPLGKRMFKFAEAYAERQLQESERERDEALKALGHVKVQYQTRRHSDQKWRDMVAEREATIQRLLIDADANERDWEVIAAELGPQCTEREEMVKAIRKLKCALVPDAGKEAERAREVKEGK